MRTPLLFVCFFLVVCNAHGFINALRGIWSNKKSRDIESTLEHLPEDANTEESGSLQKVEIPKRLFSKDLAETKKSYCYEARLEFRNLCGLRSASERAKLASLVTNCHLEVSGRPVFVWDNERKLADASEHYVYLVMQFIPLMTDVCEKAGHAPLLSQLIAEANRDEEIRNKIDELQSVTERLFAANRQSSNFVREYINMSADASKQLEQMLNLSMAVKEANDLLNGHREAIHQEANDIKAQLLAFTKNSVTLFDAMFGRFDGFQTQMTSMATAVGQIESDSHATTMFLKDPIVAISSTTNFMTNQQTNSKDNLTSPLASFRKIGFVKNVILGPIKLSEKLRHLESNRFFGPFAKDIFSSLQFLLILMSIYIAYTILTLLTNILEAALRFAAILRPAQPLVSRVSYFFGKGDRSKSTIQARRMKEHISEDITTSIAKAFNSSVLTEKLDKLLWNEQSEARLSQLLARVSELDMRLSQISQDVRLLHQTMLSLGHPHIRESGTTIFSHELVGLQSGQAENPSSSMSLVTTAERESAHCDSGPECKTPCGRDSRGHQNRISVKGLNDSTNRGKDNISQKENNATKPQVTRRRSSRKTGNMHY